MAIGLEEYAQYDPDRLIVSDEKTSYTRVQFNDRVNRTINMLWGLGVKPGSSAAIMSKNCTDFLTVACAAALGGVSIVPVNWHFKEEEASYIIGHANARVLFVDADCSAVGKAAAERAGCGRVIQLGKEFDALVDASSDAAPPEDSPFASAIYFTSGTTGRPKPTRLSQQPTNIPASVALKKLTRNATLSGMSGETTHLVQGPLYHAGPLGNAVPAILLGGQVYIMPKFDPEQALRFIERYKITHSLMVPTMFVRMLKLPGSVRSGYDTSSLKVISHIAAPMPVHVKLEMIDWWGPILIDAYGASEIGVITRINSEEWLKKPGSVGRPIKDFTIEIIGEDNEELPTNEIGQIYITSLTDVDLEYLGDPARTEQAHRGPKQFTLGDMGRLDEDGYLFLSDRRVDLINSGGVNIYPAEIEAVLLQHPAVADVAVFGIPNDEWGQEVKAAVQLEPNRTMAPALEKQIIEWGKQRLATYKVPKTIAFLNELPRYSNGKLHRRELRDAYWKDAPAQQA